MSSHPIAIALREFTEFKIIPMLNPDGVFNGNERLGRVFHSLIRRLHLVSLINKVFLGWCGFESRLEWLFRIFPSYRKSRTRRNSSHRQPAGMKSRYLSQFLLFIPASHHAGSKPGIHNWLTCSSLLTGDFPLWEFIRRLSEASLSFLFSTITYLNKKISNY